MQTMTINKQDYQNLKEYWDYQRKVQYNREVVYRMAERFEYRVFNETGMVPLNEIQSQLWSKVSPKYYEDPPKDWIPEDSNLRFEWENAPGEESNKAVNKWNEEFNIISEDFKKQHDDNSI